MDLFDVVFARGGRLPRLAFFLANLAVMVVVAVCAVVLALGMGVTGAMTVLSFGAAAPGFILVAILFLAMLAAYVYAGINLQVKRLHDLGLSGYNVFWTQGVCFVWTMMHHGHRGIHSPIELAFGVATLGVSLWLLFMPGQDRANRYGLQPA